MNLKTISRTVDLIINVIFMVFNLVHSSNMLKAYKKKEFINIVLYN